MPFGKRRKCLEYIPFTYSYRRNRCTENNFYTAIYHLFIQPNNIADVDGKIYWPTKGNSAIVGWKVLFHWSQWDIFRAAYPLYTVISPELIPDFVNSMLDYANNNGICHMGIVGTRNYTMIGNHSVPMIVDAYLKGFEGFDPERAYNEVKKSLTLNHPKSIGRYTTNTVIIHSIW